MKGRRAGALELGDKRVHGVNGLGLETDPLASILQIAAVTTDVF